jgi:hypothetical protein
MSVGSRGAISLARDTTVIDSRAVVISVVRIIQKVAALMTLRPAVQPPIGRPPKCPVLQPFPEQHQASPSHAKIFTRSARLEDRPRERILAERLAHQRRKPVAPFLKSTGLVTTSTRMPTGTVIMTPPVPAHNRAYRLAALISATIRAFCSAVQRRRRPAPVNTSPSRRTGSASLLGLGKSSVSDICPTSSIEVRQSPITA